MPKKIVLPEIDEALEDEEYNASDSVEDVEEALENIENSLEGLEKLAQESLETSETLSTLVNQNTVIKSEVENTIEIINQSYEDLGLPYCKKCGELFLVDLYQNPICPIASSNCSRNLE